MSLRFIGSLVIAVVVAASSVVVTGCYGEMDEPVFAEGYQPQYYDGYVVYFDGEGRPFYYGGGGAVWIPRESPYYVGYVNHWHAYGPQYRGWYARRGYRYRSYHRGGGRR